MKKILVVFLLLPFIVLSQNSKTINNELIIDKWIKAVVSIEVYPNFTHAYDSIRTSTNLTTVQKYQGYKLLDTLKLIHKTRGSAIS